MNFLRTRVEGEDGFLDSTLVLSCLLTVKETTFVVYRSTDPRYNF